MYRPVRPPLLAAGCCRTTFARLYGNTRSLWPVVSLWTACIIPAQGGLCCVVDQASCDTSLPGPHGPLCVAILRPV